MILYALSMPFLKKKIQYLWKLWSINFCFSENIEYFTSKTRFESLYTELSANQYIASGTVDSWFKSYTDWLATSPAAASGKTTGTKDLGFPFIFSSNQNFFWILPFWYAEIWQFDIICYSNKSFTIYITGTGILTFWFISRTNK